MSPQTMPPEVEMMKIILGKWISKPVHAAVKLGIPDILAEGGKRTGDLAEITGTRPGELYRMMRALAGVGIFAETEDRVFTNTPLSECLMEGRLKAASLMFHSSWHDKMWDNLLHTLQTGEPAFEKVHGENAFDWLGKHPDEAKIFHEANAFKAASTHGAIAGMYDFTGIDTLIDAGGGLGGLMFTILEANPDMKGIVAELPETVGLLEKIIGEKDFGNRMKAVECDFFKEISKGGDAYLFSNIMHDWPDEKCEIILKNCRAAMVPENKLLIVEAIVPPGNAFSIAKLLDLEVLLMGGGRERTEIEYENLLETSGFRLSRVTHAGPDVSVIEGIPMTM